MGRSPTLRQRCCRSSRERRYEELGWARDKWLRDTGPFIGGEYFGTHPAVRVYYSPEVIRWLEGGRKGRIPDGAVIVKEQYAPARCPPRGQDGGRATRRARVVDRDGQGFPGRLRRLVLE